jgi:hypothetical protein
MPLLTTEARAGAGRRGFLSEKSFKNPGGWERGPIIF